MIDILYGDYEGGQRTIARVGVGLEDGLDGFQAEMVRYWNVDREDPRDRGCPGRCVQSTDSQREAAHRAVII
jgi:hypothetical protein